MAVKLHIKQIKPVMEISPLLEGRPLLTKFGVKVYDSDELEQVRAEYTETASRDTLEQALAQLMELENNGDKTTEEFYTQRKQLRTKINEESEHQRKLLEEFYKKQVVYIKNATLTDDEGKEIKVDNTENVKAIESLWETPEECLAVLLDIYFGAPSLKDSLSQKIVETILNLPTEDKIKN